MPVSAAAGLAPCATRSFTRSSRPSRPGDVQKLGGVQRRRRSAPQQPFRQRRLPARHRKRQQRHEIGIVVRVFGVQQRRLGLQRPLHLRLLAHERRPENIQPRPARQQVGGRLWPAVVGGRAVRRQLHHALAVVAAGRVQLRPLLHQPLHRRHPPAPRRLPQQRPAVVAALAQVIGVRPDHRPQPRQVAAHRHRQALVRQLPAPQPRLVQPRPHPALIRYGVVSARLLHGRHYKHVRRRGRCRG